MESTASEELDIISVSTIEVQQKIKDDYNQEMERLSKLPEMLKNVHAKILYFNPPEKSALADICYNIHESMVKLIGGSHNLWMNLGYMLDLHRNDINFIQNSIPAEEKVVKVLKLFANEDTSTLDKILEALIKLQNVDIVSKLEHLFLQLVEQIQEKSQDLGYSSDFKSSLPAKSPSCFEPKDLSRDCVKNSTLNFLLTYAEDGSYIVNDIKEIIKQWAPEFEVDVVTLNDRKFEVMQNLFQCITNYVEKATLVVPIVTENYLHDISEKKSVSANTKDNLDIEYNHLIYKLLMNNYVFKNGLCNKNVRCVVPDNIDNRLLCSNISQYPILTPWTCLSDFNNFFREMLVEKFSNP